MKLFLLLLLAVAQSAGACSLERYRWFSPEVPLHFRFAPQKWQQSFVGSERAWNNVGSRIQISPGNVRGLAGACMEGANTIGMGKSLCGRDWDKGVLAVTLVQYNVSTGGVTQGVIVYNTNVAFDIYPGTLRPGITDFGRVTLHELGHFLGLAHETRTASIMAPIISNRDTLSADDTACLKSIYR